MRFMFLLSKSPKSDPSSLSYLLGCGGKGKAIAVDVFPEDIDWFVQQAATKEVEINYVIDTHIHADHLSGACALALTSGAAHCLHQSSAAEFAFSPLTDGQILNIGNVSAKIIHTAGHTEDSICLLITDNRRSKEPWFLLTGHTLFVGSVGRPDLQGREREMADLLYHSIFEKILTLPAHIEIYPGAQAGSVCGAGLSGKPSSTLFFEKRFNRLLNYNKSDFINAVLAEIPPKPVDMIDIIQQNMRGADK